MVIQNKRTQEEQAISLSEWGKMKELGINRKFRVLDSTDMPKFIGKSNTPPEVVDFIGDKKNESEDVVADNPTYADLYTKDNTIDSLIERYPFANYEPGESKSSFCKNIINHLNK